uniref:Uncharacterized protein n=1 Tax=Cricetulus griseus TaxID=10029 RepID=A0A8C2LK57_CRIGR
MPKKKEQEAKGMPRGPWRTSAMRSSSLCCAPPLPPALLSLPPPPLPSSMLPTAPLPLCKPSLARRPALAEAAPAIFVPGGPVARTRLAGEGIPAGKLCLSWLDKYFEVSLNFPSVRYRHLFLCTLSQS